MNDLDVGLRDSSSIPMSGTLERCLHVVALASLTVAQPLLDLLARHAEFFVAHRFNHSDIGFLLVWLMVVIPLPVLVLELLLARAPRRLARVVHGTVVAGFAALWWLLVLKRADSLSGRATLAAAALAGLLIAIVYLKARPLRFFVSVLAIGFLVVPAAFLASPQVRKITSTRQATFLELPSVTSTSPIIFIILDEFATSVLLDEDRQINPHRYPNLAALAQTSFWFPNAVSVAEISEAAIPAILTGNYPKAGGLPQLADHPQNLFTLFGGAYEIWAQEPMTRLCPSELNLQSPQRVSLKARWKAILSDLVIIYSHALLPEPYNARLPSIDTTWRDFATQADAPKATPKSFFKMAVEATRRDRREEFELFTASLEKRSAPGLHFLHILLPHRPWEFLPQGQRYQAGPVHGLKKEVWSDNELFSQQGFQSYILQTQFVDTAIGRIVRRLEEVDLFDRSLLVLLGDHGASFIPGVSRRIVSEANAHDIIPIPLLIKAPDQQEGQTVAHPVRAIDVLPTILDLLEVEAPWTMDGQSGFDPPRQDFQFVTKRNGTLTVDPAIHEKKYDSVRWKLELFGTGEDHRSLYRLGPNKALIGQSLAALAPDRAGPENRANWRAEVKDLERFHDVSSTSGLPVSVNGSVVYEPVDKGDEPTLCCQLALALNGTVVATTETHTETGARRHFSARLPAEALHEGAHQLEIYQILDGEVRSLPLRAE